MEKVYSTINTIPGTTEGMPYPLKAAKWSKALGDVKTHVEDGTQSSFDLVVH